MAAPINYTWQAGDRLWRVVGRKLKDSGYTGTVALKEAIRSTNSITNSLKIPAGTIIYIPVRS